MGDINGTQQSNFSPMRRFWIALLVAAVTAVLTLTAALRQVDLLIYDAGQRLADREAPQDILVVAIDEASIRELGRWPWSRERHIELLERLSQAQARAIVLDIVFADPQQSPADVDDLLAAAIRQAGNVVLPVYISELQHGSQLLEVLPLPAISSAAAALGHAHYENDTDGVCRAVFLREGIGEPYWPHLSVALAGMLGESVAEALPGLQRDQAVTPYLVQRNYRNLIPFFGSTQPFTSVSFLDVLQGDVPAGLLRDKIVFVGATAAGLGDRVVTPTSSADALLSGVELNATIYHALRTDGFIQSVAPPWQLTLNILVAFLVGLFTAFMAPRQLILFVTSGVAGLGLLALAGPYYTGIWVAPSAMCIAFVLSYLLWSLSRLQQALSYLQAELGALSAERSLLRHSRDMNEIYTGLHFLTRMLPLNGWSMFTGSERLVSWGVAPGNMEISEPARDRWQHRGSVSAIRLRLEDASYELRVRWENESDTESRNSLMLDTLVGDFVGRSRRTLPKAPEAITDAILKLQKANYRFREISHLAQRSLSRMVDGIAITDRSGRVLFENLQFRGLLHSADYAKQENILDLMKSMEPVLGEQWDEILRPVYIESKVAQCEAVTPAGVHVLCQAQTLSSEVREQLVMLVITDISALKEYERARRETLNFLSHDLRSPLVSILALIENARGESRGAADQELLDQVERYANTNLRFAESFLQLARAETDETISFEPTDMHAVISNAIGQVSHLAAARDIKLRQSYSDEDAWVMGHSDLLDRAVVNLLSNAIKYSDPQSEVTTRLDVAGDKVTCEVQDEGIGIPAEDLGTIFQKFQRGASSDSQKRKGTGLGLRFVSVVCKRHGGVIEVQSEQGKGSVFSMTLPRFDME